MLRNKTLNRFRGWIYNLVKLGSVCTLLWGSWTVADYVLDKNRYEKFHGNTSVIREVGYIPFTNEQLERYITPLDKNQLIELNYSGEIDNIYSPNPWWKSWNVHKDYEQLVISPKIPDIFSYEVELEKVTINDRDVPLSFFTQTPRIREDSNNLTSAPEYRANLNSLLNEGIITPEDFFPKSFRIYLKVDGKLHLNEYRTVTREEVGTFKDLEKIPPTIKRFTDSTDYYTSLELYPINNPKIQNIAKDLKNGKENVLDVVRACYDYTLNHLTYYEEELHLNAIEAIEDGREDCDGYASVFVTLCRACGIPAKEASIDDKAYLPDLSIPWWHDWAEVCVPLTDGSYKWILVEPTWGDTDDDPDKYFQCRDDAHLYLLELGARLEN